MTDCEELEREIEKLKKEINKLKAGQEWAEDELGDHNKRITTIEKILDVYYDQERGQYRSKYLARVYATLKKLERKVFPQQQKAKAKP